MRCPNCNTLWPEELAGMLKFCGACGAPMTVAPSAGFQLPATSDPGGGLRYVNVLFADLAGFTAFAEDRPPDEVSSIVGDLLQQLGKVVEQHNGAVYQFLGDAVVATFGLPRPDPNAARNAVRSGLAMQETTAQFSQQHGYSFGLRVGIHAGEVMFRSLGGSWTMMGDTMNTAGRIQAAAPPGRVWISRTVYEEVRRYFTLITRPGVELKGKKQAVQPYEIVAERHTPLVNLPRFVGREREWHQLQAALQEAIRERALRLVLIRGAAGVGKSRLVWELRDWIQRQPAVYRLDIAQYDHSEHLPSHGLNALIRNRFDLSLDWSESEIIARLRQRMPQENLSIEPGREELAVEFFAFVLGISHPEFHIYSVDGKGKWEGAFVELKEWMQSHAGQTPWIWILEDAQKGDADTAAFLDWALRARWSEPVLVIVTVREEDFTPECYWHDPIARWLEEGLIHEIRLREIPPDVLAQALTIMAEGAVPETMALHIAEHTDGNPLFATELVLLLRYRAIQSGDISWAKLTLPGSIREVMEARLELQRHHRPIAGRFASHRRIFREGPFHWPGHRQPSPGGHRAAQSGE